MILKQLLEDIYEGLGWWGIVNHLVSLYPDQVKNADGYLSAVAELVTLEPGDAGGFSLHVTMETEPGFLDGDDFEPWAHVFGKNGNTNRDNDEDGWHLPKDPTSEQVEWYDSEATWAMELSEWNELLAMEVVTDLPLPDALAYILWEITWFGFSSDEVKEKNTEINSDKEEIETRLISES